MSSVSVAFPRSQLPFFRKKGKYFPGCQICWVGTRAEDRDMGTTDGPDSSPFLNPSEPFWWVCVCLSVYKWSWKWGCGLQGWLLSRNSSGHVRTIFFPFGGSSGLWGCRGERRTQLWFTSALSPVWNQTHGVSVSVAQRYWFQEEIKTPVWTVWYLVQGVSNEWQLSLRLTQNFMFLKTRTACPSDWAHGGWEDLGKWWWPMCLGTRGGANATKMPLPSLSCQCA